MQADELVTLAQEIRLQRTKKQTIELKGANKGLLSHWLTPGNSSSHYLKSPKAPSSGTLQNSVQEAHLKH